jgi:tetratricopeptide (TPR) repeat protein
MIPIERMWNRIDVTRSDAEGLLFYDLMYLGEMVTKLIVIGLIAEVGENRERQRYAIEHTLVRADGIGEWVRALDDLTKGPISSLLADEASTEKRQLIQKFAKEEESWQRQAVVLLDRVSQRVDIAPVAKNNKVALVSWFQTFAALRNRTRGHGATLGGACADMAPEFEDSLRLICDNYLGFSQPWVFLKRNLTGKYRVTPIAGDTSEFDYLKRQNDVDYPNGVFRGVGSRLCVVPLIYTDADLLDFRFTNGNYRESRFETLSYLTDETVDEESENYVVPPSELPLSGTAGGPSIDLIGDTFANLPLNIPDYVSRPDLEAEITQLLTDERHAVVTLAGRGGVGKTSTAIEVLNQIALAGNYFAVLWFSARDIDLLPDGPKAVRPDVLTQEEIAAQFVELMNPPGSSDKGFDQVGYFRDRLGRTGEDGPILFVFDNFETVRNSIDVYRMIDTYIRPPNRVLITSRSRAFKGDYPVEVHGMTRPEFTELASVTAARLGITELLSPKFMDDLFNESDGHPYVVKVLLGEVATHKDRRSVERVMADRDDILEALFERTYSALPPSAQRLFLTLASWRSIVPRLAVEASLLRPENERMDVSSAIDVLERNSLIEVISGPTLEQEFLQVPLTACIFGKKKLAVSPMKTAVEADSAILQMFGAAKAGQADKGIGPRIDRMIMALATRAARGEDVEGGLKVLEYVARQYSDAWLKIADLREELGQIPGAADAIRSFLESNPESSLGWRRLATLSARNGDYLGELSALCDVARLPGASIDDASRAANTFNSLVSYRKIDLRGDDKRVMAEGIRRILERRIANADATTLSRLAWLCLHLGDRSAARKYVDAGLKLDGENVHCISLSERLRNGRG